VLVGGVIGYQFDQDFQRALMCLRDQLLKILHVSVHRMDAAVIADVVSVVAQRRGGNRQQPDGIHAKVAQVVQLFRDAFQVPPAVGVAVPKGAHIQLIKNVILVPEGILSHFSFLVGHFLYCLDILQYKR